MTGKHDGGDVPPPGRVIADAAVLDEAAVVALGANLPSALGGPEATLEAALAALPAHGFTVLARSRWWRSAAWPDPGDPPFLNGVALARTALPPTQALAALHAVERAFGRDRRASNAPRTLDLDLIALGRTISASSTLTLPHPRAAERRFVVGPLAEIAPAWRLPGDGRTAAQLAAAAPVGQDAAPLG